MAYKYLNQEGLRIVWDKIKANFGAVDKITLAGNAATMTNKVVNIPVFGGASTAAGGSVGLVPAPSVSQKDYFLKADGSWAMPVGSTYAAGTGLTLSGTTFNHANSITASTVGSASSTSGITLEIPYAVFNDTGHITSKGTHTHTIPNASTSVAGIMSTAYASKLEGIATGAEVNQNAFSNVKIGSTTVAAETTTDTLNLAGSGSVSITANANTDTITISGTNTTYSTATTAANGLMSSADKIKLNEIASGAQVNQNAFTTIKVGTTDLVADSKTDTLTITAGNNITLTPNASSDSFSIAATDTKYTSGTGITVDGTTINHSNSITSGTIGSSSASSGATLAIPYASYDGQGHITGKGTHTHTISGLAASVISSGTLSTAVLPIVPVDKGGTGASTPDTARSNLGAAPLASPNFTGTPTAPTPSTSSTATAVVNKKYVDDSIAAAQTNAATFQGVASASAPSTASIYKAGYYWIVDTEGKYVNNAFTCEPGDMIFAIASTTTTGTGSTADFTVIQQNLSPMDQADINTATPLT